MPNLSPVHLLVVLVVALVVLGPDKLPRLARQAGGWIRDLRELQEHLRAQVDETLGPDFASLRDLGADVAEAPRRLLSPALPEPDPADPTDPGTDPAPDPAADPGLAASDAAPGPASNGNRPRVVHAPAGEEPLPAGPCAASPRPAPGRLPAGPYSTVPGARLGTPYPASEPPSDAGAGPGELLRDRAS